MFQHPEHLYYSQRHVWVDPNIEEQTALIGITEDLADELDEFASIDMPLIHDELEMEQLAFHLHLEGENIYHLRSPLTARVIEINKDVLDNPNLLHLSPYEFWLCKLEYDEPEELEMLMNASQYMRYTDQLPG